MSVIILYWYGIMLCWTRYKEYLPFECLSYSIETVIIITYWSAARWISHSNLKVICETCKVKGAIYWNCVQCRKRFVCKRERTNTRVPYTVGSSLANNNAIYPPYTISYSNIWNGLYYWLVQYGKLHVQLRSSHDCLRLMSCFEFYSELKPCLNALSF